MSNNDNASHHKVQQKHVTQTQSHSEVLNYAALLQTLALAVCLISVLVCLCHSLINGVLFESIL